MVVIGDDMKIYLHNVIIEAEIGVYGEPLMKNTKNIINNQSMHLGHLAYLYRLVFKDLVLKVLFLSHDRTLFKTNNNFFKDWEDRERFVRGVLRFRQYVNRMATNIDEYYYKEDNKQR